MNKSIVLWLCLLTAFVSFAAETPKKLAVSAQLAKPSAITMAELAQLRTEGVAICEVSDYVFGKYQGDFPSPPHADLNPKKAFIIFWKDYPFRFVFAHEGSYCPWFEFPSGAAVCYQFFEGNNGWAELFNQWGRQERNSFVDILERGPQRVWVRWTYLGVNLTAGEPGYRATEDFWAYPNGLILRRQTYTSLIPEENKGYAREPIELIGMCPAGQRWVEVLRQVPGSEERHSLAVFDAFTQKRYDVYWLPKPGTLWDATIRRVGCDWQEIDDAAGVVLILPMAEGSAFCVVGDASGYRHDYTMLRVGVGSLSWDHWPIGRLNSQEHLMDEESLKHYPNHFAPAVLSIRQLPNEESARGIYYSLLGVGRENWEAIRQVARLWLQKGAVGIADPNSAADLPTVSNGVQR